MFRNTEVLDYNCQILLPVYHIQFMVQLGGGFTEQ